MENKYPVLIGHYTIADEQGAIVLMDKEEAQAFIDGYAKAVNEAQGTTHYTGHVLTDNHKMTHRVSLGAV